MSETEGKRKATVLGRPFLHAGWEGHPTTLCGTVARGVATVRDLRARPGCPACTRLVNEQDED